MEKDLCNYVIELYKKGYCIDYIINELLYLKKIHSKSLCNCDYCKRSNGDLKKSDIKSDVYKIIYLDNKSKSYPQKNRLYLNSRYRCIIMQLFF